MFSYHPRFAYYPNERKPPSQEPRQKSAGMRCDSSLASDKYNEESTKSVYTRASKSSYNPTVFETYNPKLPAEFVSKEVTTTLGPLPEYINGYAVYTLENPIAPRVRVFNCREVRISFASETVLKFYLPPGTSAVDIEVNLCNNKLVIRVPHCLVATQECHIIDVHDGPLGDEDDEYGYYESLCRSAYMKEQERKRKEEERQMRKRLDKIQRKQKEALTLNQDRYVYNDLFEPRLCFTPSIYRPSLSAFFM